MKVRKLPPRYTSDNVRSNEMTITIFQLFQSLIFLLLSFLSIFSKVKNVKHTKLIILTINNNIIIVVISIIIIIFIAPLLCHLEHSKCCLEASLAAAGVSQLIHPSHYIVKLKPTVGLVPISGEYIM